MSTTLSTSECTIDFPTSPAWFRSIRKLITSAATQCGFSNREAGQVSMAVDEALSNIYRHGYMGSTDGRVRFTYKTYTTPLPKIMIEIEDDAIQVDSNLIQSRDLQDIKPGGLGVHLIQTVMNHATWTKRDQGGMKLSMSKTATNTHTTPIQSAQK
ncbi:MAG: ATP-binding protein [Phycisphaerales bacterium]|nr:ATP-binding protein [Planctomycetota bacterium]MBL6997987.1 ATP-binding protein [Phycisphaerales bacterium]